MSLSRYLRHNGPEHVLTYAPTRSGKGVGLVVPTLLSWPDSCVITDLKGELWAMTAGWRQKYAKNKVLRFEPADPNCEVFHNAMDEIRVGSGNEVGDVQSLATLIVDPDGKGLPAATPAQSTPPPFLRYRAPCGSLRALCAAW
jgi:type IV secretion system protein VirD4